MLDEFKKLLEEHIKYVEQSQINLNIKQQNIKSNMLIGAKNIATKDKKALVKKLINTHTKELELLNQKNDELLKDKIDKFIIENNFLLNEIRNYISSSLCAIKEPVLSYVQDRIENLMIPSPKKHELIDRSELTSNIPSKKIKHTATFSQDSEINSDAVCAFKTITEFSNLIVNQYKLHNISSIDIEQIVNETTEDLLESFKKNQQIAQNKP